MNSRSRTVCLLLRRMAPCRTVSQSNEACCSSSSSTPACCPSCRWERVYCSSTCRASLTGVVWRPLSSQTRRSLHILLDSIIVVFMFIPCVFLKITLSFGNPMHYCFEWEKCITKHVSLFALKDIHPRIKHPEEQTGSLFVRNVSKGSSFHYNWFQCRSLKENHCQKCQRK